MNSNTIKDCRSEYDSIAIGIYLQRGCDFNPSPPHVVVHGWVDKF